MPDLTNSLLSSSLISLRGLIPHDAAIINACKTGNSTKVEQLLTSRKARPDDATLDNSTALSTAIKNDQIEIVQLLLRAGADPNLPAGRLQDSPIQIAVARNNSQITRLLLNYGADLQYCSAGSWSILHHLFNPDTLFSKNEYYSIFGDELTFDDIRDPKGWTALHRCAAFGTANDVYKLVDLGASSLADGYVTLWGRSPLHIAAIMDNVSTLQALTDMYIGDHNMNDGVTQQHAILETADINGWTPLHLAIYSRAMNTAKWLLSKKVDVHKITYRTAIWFPQNQTNVTFSVMDVANMAGEKVLEVFPSLLVDAGYDITTDGSDIYW
ncbi:hypothetical protein G7054_g9125 [Neopestalotiopsis clavispora]|nr:hypothetical protein G7054_g9125 [Neopestalotiopsis clavispora]